MNKGPTGYDEPANDPSYYTESPLVLTKREVFAMAAMQGLLASYSYTGIRTNVAKKAVALADQLLEELEESV